MARSGGPSADRPRRPARLAEGEAGLLGTPIVVVSACDAAYASRELNMIASVQYWSPQSKIIIYDLGMNEKQREAIAGACNVQLRTFPFDRYPLHVRVLKKYAWKPIIIREVVQEFGWCLWLDSSMELRTPLTEVRAALGQAPRDGTGVGEMRTQGNACARRC